MRERRASLLLCIACVAGCFSRRANERYQARLFEINSAYTASAAEIEREYADLAQQIKKMSQFLIEVQPNAHSLPVHAVRDRPELVGLVAQCDDIATKAKALIENGSDTANVKPIVDQCMQSYWRTYVQVLGTTYWAADVSWILTTLNTSESIDVESLFAYSHNLRIQAYMDAELQKADEFRSNSLRQLAFETAQSQQIAEQTREVEVAQAQRRFALAMSAMGQAMSRQSTTHPITTQDDSSNTAAYSGATKSCSSDYNCGVGYTCVKANYASSGFCAQSVNSFGTPTFDLPKMESVLVKMPSAADCNFDTDCPIGFRCNVRSGACLR
jgi:hypothetical protein